jgi:hypothetical protein
MLFSPRSWLALAISAALSTAALHADSKKLTDDQRIEILRGLTAEYAKIKVLLPISKKALEFHTDGTWDQAKWKDSEKEMGPAGRVGDLIQVTHVGIGKDRIVLELNGGGKARGKWTDHIQVGIGMRTTPITGGQTNAPGGTAIRFCWPSENPSERPAKTRMVPSTKTGYTGSLRAASASLRSPAIRS